MTSSQPLAETRVSALIVVRDGERYLGAAIESALSQTVSCHEVVVVDNGSRDRSRAVAEEYLSAGVRVVDEPQPGTARARNAALLAAGGSHLAFLDSDDLWEPGKNEVQLAALGTLSSPDVVFGHAIQFTEAAPGPLQPAAFLTTALASRESWNQIGRWPVDVGNVGEGLDWLIRFRRAGLSELMLDDVVMRRRIHDANVGIRERHQRSEYARILKAELDRRRAARQ